MNGKKGLEWPSPQITAKIGFMRSTQGKAISIFQRHFEYPEEHNRAARKHLWLSKFHEIIARTNGYGMFLIELEEEWNFWYFAFPSHFYFFNFF